MRPATSNAIACVAPIPDGTAWLCAFDRDRSVTARNGTAACGSPSHLERDRSVAANENPTPDHDLFDSGKPSAANRQIDGSCLFGPTSANDNLVVPVFFYHRNLSPSCRSTRRHEDRSKELDQFYTKAGVAELCYSVFRDLYGTQRHLTVDPCAGEGAFFSLMPFGSLGIDLDPKYPGLFAADFLRLDLSSWLQPDKPVAVIGNPPFGRAASMALKFIKHAACCPDVEVIAFILPPSIRKAGIQNRIDANFDLVCDLPLPAYSYIFRGKDHDVPTVFQIWERKTTPRAVDILPTSHPDFCFTSQAEADFAIRRNGFHAGRICGPNVGNPGSYHFIRGRVRSRMKRLDFSPFYQNVSGPRSLSKGEVVLAYTRQFGDGSRRSRRSKTR